MTGLIRQVGLTLVELLIAGLLSTIIVLVFLQKIQTQVVDVQYEDSADQIQILHRATIGYYDTHCADALFVQPTLFLLVTDGYLSNVKKVQVPGTVGPTILIQNVATNLVGYSYNITYPTAGDAETAAAKSRNASFVGTSVTWAYSNNAVESDTATDAYQYLNAFGEEICG
jgi:type II secretory pathway pseudopilin PulG